MCLSCGCGAYYCKHDPASIDWADLQAAADDADLTPHQAAWNIVRGARGAADDADADDADDAEDGAAVKGLEVGFEVVKAADEKRYTLGLAYGANLPDVGKAKDGHRDFAGPDVLEEAAWAYMRKGAKVGLSHKAGTDGAGEVVESYIWPAGEWVAPNGFTVRKGDWLLGVIWDPPTWADIKAGRFNGLSMQGDARRRVPTPEALANLRRQ